MHIGDLASRIKDGRPLLLLVGAGISVRAGIPSANAIVDEMNERLGISDEERIATYADSIRAGLPTLSQRRQFFERKCVGKHATDEHLWIAELMRRNAVAGVVTTNFDQLIEQALLLLGYSGHHVVLPDTEVGQSVFPASCPPLFKIHGDFLFDHIANLPEELAELIGENVRVAIQGLAQRGDILVVGYAGNDGNVMSNLFEVVCRRTEPRTKIWWSEFRVDPLVDTSPFSKLLALAEESDNPVERLGPQSAVECLARLGVELGLTSPRKLPFGIGEATLADPVRYLPRIQPLAGTKGTRAEAMRRHTPLMIAADQGGIIHVQARDELEASLVLSALAEARAPKSLYFDRRFAKRPAHLELVNQCVALEQLNSPPSKAGSASPKSLFEGDVAVFIDSIERYADGRKAILDESLVGTVRTLADGQRLAGRGLLVIATKFSMSELRSATEGHEAFGWLSSISGSYTIDASVVVPEIAYQAPSALLDTLAHTEDAILAGIALQVAGCPGEALFDAISRRAVDKRGIQVALRRDVRSVRLRDLDERPRLVATQMQDLAERMLHLADRTPYFIRPAIVLQAEGLLWRLPSEKFRALKLLRAISIKGELVESFAESTYREYAVSILDDPSRWKDLDFETKRHFIQKAASWAQGHVWQQLLPLIRDVLSMNLSRLELAIIKADIDTFLPGGMRCYDSLEERDRWIELEKALEAGDPELAEGRWRRLVLIDNITNLIREYRGSSAPGDPKGQTPESVLSAAAFDIGAIYLDLAETPPLEDRRRWLHRAMKWSRRSVRHAKSAGDPYAAGLATDNAVPALLGLESFTDAREVLDSVIDDVCAEEGFTSRKAVTWGNYFILELSTGNNELAETFFASALLQNAYLGRSDATKRNLLALWLAARHKENLVRSGVLPDPKEVENCLGIAESTSA